LARSSAALQPLAARGARAAGDDVSFPLSLLGRAGEVISRPLQSTHSDRQSGKWTGIKPNDLRGAHNRQKDRCPYGHALTTENTLLRNG
jgi:hypothetical protein